MEFIEQLIDQLLLKSGINANLTEYIRLVILVVLLIIIAGLTFLITKRLVINFVHKIVEKTPFKWDDLLANQQVFNNLAHVVPALIIKMLVPSIFADFTQMIPVIITLTNCYLIIVGMTIIIAFLRVTEYGLSTHEAFKDKPLNSYFQVVRIILYIITFILVLSIILNKSPIYFLSAFGAMTAILLLVFKDTILGLVASVQMSANDMVRVGDWVEMPKFDADGDVIAINLNVVKIQNWDKTITTIPTYYFITDSFKNWRGMTQSGGRRIKRSIYIDSNSIKFVDPNMREAFKKYHLINEFVVNRQQEIETYNNQNKIDTSVLINGRRMTNFGVFRRYVEHYLKNHPQIKQDMTIMVRQLATLNKGIPLEIYCFTNNTEWLQYESIQSDIFDHLYAAASFFELAIFQEPSGNDFSRVIK